MPQPNDMVVVDRLPDILSEKRMSQRSLAERAGMVQSTISYAKRNGLTREENAKKMARALGVAVEELSREGHEKAISPRPEFGMPSIGFPEGLIDSEAEYIPSIGETVRDYGAKKSAPVVVEFGPRSMGVIERLAEALEMYAAEEAR